METKTKISRPGSGRTKGSFSFCKVTLAQLNLWFSDPETPVIVSRKWLEAVGRSDVISKPSTNLLTSIQGHTPETKVDAEEIDPNEI